eukprot:1130654-Pelagomonas_calceolata.AAC.9
MSPTRKGATATMDEDGCPPAESSSPGPSKRADGTTFPSPKEHSALDDLEGFVNSVYNEAAAAKSMSTCHRAADGPTCKGAHEGGQGRGGGGGVWDAAAGKLGGGEAQSTVEKPSTSSGHGGAGEGGVENEGSHGVGERGKGEQAKASSSAAAGQDRPGSAQSHTKSVKAKGKPSNKPAWALSQAEVEKKEMSEEDELLAFTEQLDFDAFMDQLDDVELKDAFQKPAPIEMYGSLFYLAAMLELQDIDKKGGDEKAWQKSFVRACNHAAMRRVQKEKRPANSDDEGDDDCAQSVGSRSIASTRLRAKSALREALDQKQGQWDASTRAGDDVARMEQASKATAAAEEFLIENPELRAIHSNASVRALMDKASVAEQPHKQHGAIKAS